MKLLAVLEESIEPEIGSFLVWGCDENIIEQHEDTAAAFERDPNRRISALLEDSFFISEIVEGPLLLVRFLTFDRIQKQRPGATLSDEGSRGKTLWQPVSAFRELFRSVIWICEPMTRRSKLRAYHSC